MSKLVIVESPAKAKTIKKYLGAGYEVMASMGHVRDLPKSLFGVDVDNGFKPRYVDIAGKTALIRQLKSAAAESDSVILATDPDREGEAISWHLAHLLKVDTSENNRVTFNEITKAGIKNGMDNPRNLDMNLVNAQQARRILDRIVGYKLSPFLWKKIRKGLSAGRVQSVAVRIIVDREEEIRAFVSEEYWTIDAMLSDVNGSKIFPARFYGDKNGKIKITEQKTADEILGKLENTVFTVNTVKVGQRKTSPAPPFITSTLQQEASRKLGFNARRTMSAAQELYEGVEVGEYGAVGLITYMRTDSLRISEEARTEGNQYIRETWGEKYLPQKPRYFKSKNNAQDAHEAIRPSMPTLTPQQVKDSLSSDQYKLYKLIWDRFMASLMANCIHDTCQTDLVAGDYIFKASGYSVNFDGYTVLYIEGSDEDEEDNGKLPVLKEGQTLEKHELKGNQHFTQPPPRYTEATLIKTMEAAGIGRPSTYAPTITTITSREYIERDGKALKPTQLGEITTQLMRDMFPEIVDTEFTANVEQRLDQIDDGKSDWVQTLGTFYSGFAKTLDNAEKNTSEQKFVIPDEESDVVCDLCGLTMVIKSGRYGKFLACPGYPDCKNTKRIVKETGGICPKCGKAIAAKKSKKGKMFYGCSGYPDCDFITWNEPSREVCPKCGKTLFKKKGKTGTLFCGTEGCGYTPSEGKDIKDDA